MPRGDPRRPRQRQRCPTHETLDCRLGGGKYDSPDSVDTELMGGPEVIAGVGFWTRSASHLVAKDSTQRTCTPLATHPPQSQPEVRCPRLYGIRDDAAMAATRMRLEARACGRHPGSAIAMATTVIGIASVAADTRRPDHANGRTHSGACRHSSTERHKGRGPETKIQCAGGDCKRDRPEQTRDAC